MSNRHTVFPGDSIQFGDSPTPCPSDVRLFLKSRGWEDYSDSFNKFGTAYVNLKWEQAVAVEFVTFVTLGGPR